jgi:hypothetical protein
MSYIGFCVSFCVVLAFLSSQANLLQRTPDNETIVYHYLYGEKNVDQLIQWYTVTPATGGNTNTTK